MNGSILLLLHIKMSNVNLSTGAFSIFHQGNTFGKLLSQRFLQRTVSVVSTCNITLDVPDVSSLLRLRRGFVITLHR